MIASVIDSWKSAFDTPGQRVMFGTMVLMLLAFWAVTGWIIYDSRAARAAAAAAPKRYHLEGYERHGDTHIWTYRYTDTEGNPVCVMMLKRGWDSSILQIPCPRPPEP